MATKYAQVLLDEDDTIVGVTYKHTHTPESGNWCVDFCLQNSLNSIYRINFYFSSFSVDDVILSVNKQTKQKIFDHGSRIKVNFIFFIVFFYSVRLSQPSIIVQLQYSHSKIFHFIYLTQWKLFFFIVSWYIQNPSYCLLNFDVGFVLLTDGKERKRRKKKNTTDWIKSWKNFYIFDAMRPKQFRLSP